MGHFSIRLLGIQEIRHSAEGLLDVPDICWPVIGCLLIAPGQRSSRGRLVAQIWPDQDDEAGRHCLATALWRIRQKFPKGREPLEVRAEGVALNTGTRLWIDVIAFERRARMAIAHPGQLADPRMRLRLSRALSLYRGDFLAERSEEALAIERARLRSLYLDAMYELAQAEARASDWARARLTAHDLCAAEPLREDAQRLLIEAYFRCGNRGLALRQFELCADILHDELAVAPMPETVALAESIRARRPGPLPTAPLAPNAIRDVARTPLSDDYRATLLATREHLLRTLAVIEQSLTE